MSEEQLERGELARSWILWLSKRNQTKTHTASTYESTMVGSEPINTVLNTPIQFTSNNPQIEEFFNIYNHITRPQDLPNSSDLSLFREGVKPMWEDAENKEGGRWMVRLRKGICNRLWEDMMIGLLGETFDVGDEVCGCVISMRYGEDILSVWNRQARSEPALIRIRDMIKKTLKLPPDTNMEYKPHDASLRQLQGVLRKNTVRSSVKGVEKEDL